MIFNNYKTPFFIAEISANHCGSIDHAKKLIYTAKIYGADAVKLQTYTPDTITIKSDKKDFKINRGLWKGETLWDLYKKAQTPFEWHKDLFNYAKKLKIICFSTPFDETAVDLLESLECPFYKVASFEMNHIPLIKKIAQTKKPIIISTGMANLKEIDLAYKTAKNNGAKEIILLYCVSNYPSKISDFNLNNIRILKERYKLIKSYLELPADKKKELLLKNDSSNHHNLPALEDAFSLQIPTELRQKIVNNNHLNQYNIGLGINLKSNSSNYATLPKIIALFLDFF